MNDTFTGKPDWQVALEHHEDLCAERYKGIDKRLDNLETDMRELRRELRTGQRWIIGLIVAGCFAWPTVLVAILKFF